MTYFILVLGIIITSLISGIIGMGGGALLMGLIMFFLPVISAMLLHGITQLTSNGYRAWLFREYIYWPGIRFYMLGLLVAVLLFSSIVFVPNPALVFIILGALPFISIMIPQQFALDFMQPNHQIACGFSVTASQLLCGVSGPLLDIYFIKGRLQKNAVMATKSFTQSIGHLSKLVYYSFIIFYIQDNENDIEKIPAWLWGVAILAAIIGTRLGKSVNMRLKEQQFRQFSSQCLLVIGAFFIYRGISLMLEQ